jgi:hypothetical protein
MLNAQDVQMALDCTITDLPSERPDKSYEQGIYDALRWVLGEIPDKEFLPFDEDEA